MGEGTSSSAGTQPGRLRAAVAEDNVRVPTAEETAGATRRANRALMEMRDRDIADAAEAERHRAEQLAQWSADDRSAQAEVAAAEEYDVDEPADVVP